MIRWIHPSQGIISPIDFIPLAEETGLIIPIGDWVLRTACKQSKIWMDKGYRPLSISVNLSPKQFRQEDFVEKINSIILEEGIKGDNLELEITESTAMMDMNLTVEILHKLKTMRLRISLGDFGVGYSALNYLKELPIDIIKMDKSFVKNIIIKPDETAIVKAVTDLAQNMKLKVTTEGVETEKQLKFWQKQKCD